MQDGYVTLKDAAEFEGVSYDTMKKRVTRNPEQYKDIAVYNLFSRIGIDEGTDQKTYLNRYNAAVKFLTLVAEGKVSIGADADGDPASAAAIGFTVRSNPRLFSRGQMRGM